MVESRQSDEQPPLEVDYAPQLRHPTVPVEVVERSELLSRIADRELARRQRVSFHQLILCTSGHGVQHVDFEPIDVTPGTLLRIHPGQVQRIEPDPPFEARIVLWPVESHHADPVSPAWYPGSGVPTRWQLEETLFGRVHGWIDELADQQLRFDGSPRQVQLCQALLCSLLLRLAIELPDGAPDESQLPRAYVEFRELLEDRLSQRPLLAELAQTLGYSVRTLDRACKTATGLTAKQVLDDRIALEIRRLLTHTTRPLSQIGIDFGFDDPSNFSRFVKRNLGRPPGAIREAALGGG
ncbi:MAG: helix-turn-helix transcriptional regulator [Actinomycetota bacterium]